MLMLDMPDAVELPAGLQAALVDGRD